MTRFITHLQTRGIFACVCVPKLEGLKVGLLVVDLQVVKAGGDYRLIQPETDISVWITLPCPLYPADTEVLIPYANHSNSI
jgi:hypothetical protein